MLSPIGWRAAVWGRATDVEAVVAASDALLVGAANGVATSHVVSPGYRAHLTSGRGTSDLHTPGDCRRRSPSRTRSTSCLWQLSLTAQWLKRRCWSSPAAARGRCGVPLADTSLAAVADGARSDVLHFCLVAVTFPLGSTGGTLPSWRWPSTPRRCRRPPRTRHRGPLWTLVGGELGHLVGCRPRRVVGTDTDVLSAAEAHACSDSRSAGPLQAASSPVCPCRSVLCFGGGG